MIFLIDELKNFFYFSIKYILHCSKTKIFLFKKGPIEKLSKNISFPKFKKEHIKFESQVYNWPRAIKERPMPVSEDLEFKYVCMRRLSMPKQLHAFRKEYCRTFQLEAG